MKYQFSACALLFMALSPVSAQLASSHTSTHSAAGAAASQAVGKLVARVNGTEMTDQDLLNTMYIMFPYARQHNGSVPKELEPQIRAGAMKMMVFEELVYQEALRRKLTIPAAKMQKAETAFVGRFDSPSQFQQYVQVEYHGNLPLVRTKIKRSLLIEALLKIEVDQKSIVSPAELKAYYDKNPARFQYPESFAFQTISILPPEKVSPDQMKEGRKRAEDALRKAKATKTYEQFGMLAEKMSDDDYHVNMGDHHAVDRAKLDPSIVKVMLALKPEQVSDIIQLQNAFTIVRMNKHIPPGKMKLEDVKSNLRKEMEKNKTEQLRQAFDKKLRQNAKVEIL